MYLHFVISRNFSGIGSGMSPSLSLSRLHACALCYIFTTTYTHTHITISLKVWRAEAPSCLICRTISEMRDVSLLGEQVAR